MQGLISWHAMPTEERYECILYTIALVALVVSVYAIVFVVAEML